MELAPPVKPPRGVKPVKETSGLLMSVIRTLSASETNEQRDKEKSKLENEYKNCDKKLDELVSKHEEDLSKVMQLFATISQIVSDNRIKIAKVKENLQDCKKKLRCRRDELRNLWLEGLEYKYMLQLLEEIEKMSEVPDRLANYMSHKQYLHATELLVEAVTLGKNTLDGVESLKELSRELEQKKEQLHMQLFSELKEHLFNKPAQRILALRRQESGRDNFLMHSPLQRSTELRLSRNRMAIRRNILETTPKLDNFNVEEDLNTQNPEENSFHFIVILIKCLALLDKLPFAVNRIKDEMQVFLLAIIQRTTQHIKDFAGLQNEVDYKQALKELVQTLFLQFKEVAEANAVFLQNVEEAAKAHNTQLEGFLNEYLDIQNISSDSPVINTTDVTDLSSYFGRRKQPIKKKSLFKFDSSCSALTLSNTLKSTKKDKMVVCKPHSNNILIIFIPFMCFIEDIEQLIGEGEHGPCQLHRFITKYVSDIYLKRKSEEIIDQIEASVRAADAWKATVLLDCTADYKPLLISTVTVERCIREWRAVLQALPLYSERIAVYSCKALKEYKETCFAAYQGIVQPHSEDRRICSAAWLKDEDISRFLKSLPNWLNLKAQQEYQARSERIRRVLRRDQRSEEESPEDVRMRNRREAEILASNLGEGGVSAAEILSDMALLKELAQLQESMEWFSVRMFQYTSEFRQEPSALSPSKQENENVECSAPVSATVLQQLTSIAQEFDELANTCLLLLHLEVRVQCFHYLLAQTHYNKETHEPDPKVLELSRVLANVDEAVTSSLHPRKCKYIFEGLGHLIAKILISSAQYLQTIDEAGIQRMCRNIFALQQTLTNITMTRELALDHARHYFELFFLSPEEILNGIVEKGPEFSELEYMNAFQLLNRSQADRDLGSVTVHLERLSDILGEVGMTV
ncbi:exocyst complex component 4 [Asbolus verrucosus]|uniref:Exocyst complex component Sec8 n=1 Tax=Asbolus verrucosus TaxID=1661398 RepID=A0A482VRV2_ASBVE|nr:exocyst complex component 4 [Asbolus verrucosus]